MRRVAVTLGVVLLTFAPAGIGAGSPGSARGGQPPPASVRSPAQDARTPRDLERSAAADEARLRRGTADAALVLTRLARTYALLGDAPRLREALARLEQLAPERVRGDRELMHLAADAADRSGSREEAAAALLRFANAFPRDPRRSDVLLRAARAFERQGDHELALRLTNEALAASPEPGTALIARMERAELLENIGRRSDARDEFARVLADSPDPQTAARSLGRLVDLTVELEGRAPALLLLADEIESGPRLAAEVGRPQFLRLAAGMAEDLKRDPVQASFVVALARRAGVETSLPPSLALKAAELRESVGAYEPAALRYKSLATLDGPEGAVAQAGLVRCRPHEQTQAGAADPGRLEALAREEAWPLLFHAARSSNATGGDETSRILGARAAFMVRKPAAAGELLAPVRSTNGSAGLLRGDARALSGDWAGACGDYRAVDGAGLLAAEASWLEARLAMCAARSGQVELARRRARNLLDRAPDAPAALAAQLLLAATAPPARANTRGKGGEGQEAPTR